MKSEIPLRPLPSVEGKMAPFWEAARNGVLSLQRCTRCHRHRFPAADFCSHCLTASLEWVEASGSAELFSFVIVHHAVDPYFAARTPYAVADVKLAEGPHMITAIVGTPAEKLRIGARTRIEFEAAGEGIHLPVFRLVDD